MPRVKAQIVFVTGGFSKRVFSTIFNGGFATTSRNAAAYFTTVSQTGYAATSKNAVSLLTTISGTAFVSTTPVRTVYFVTPDPNTPKELLLKIGTLTIDGDYTYVEVPDATGEYNSLSNPGGYNVLPAPYNPYRPYRENVRLWTVYRIWNVYGKDTQSPNEQNQQDDNPYTYQLNFPTITKADGTTDIIRGIYEIILIAAPYFNEKDGNGNYASNDSGTYYIVDGTDTTFTNLNPGDYLYYVSGVDGGLYEVNEVDHVFSDTKLNLIGGMINTPAQGERLYGSATTISGMVSSGGEVFNENGYVGAPYYTITGNSTDFTSGFNYTNYFYYIDPSTGDYVELGLVLEATSATTINIYNRTENTPSLGGEILCGSGQNLNDIVFNSKGTFDTIVGTTITGIGTEFTTAFEAGQTLYYQLVNGTLLDVGVIDTIVSDTELTITSLPVNTPSSGDRLFASAETLIVISPSNGGYDSISAEQTFYTLKGFSTLFATNFAVGDNIYIVSPQGEYRSLGQVDYIISETEMVFYSPNSIQVDANDFIWANPAALSLIDLTGDFDAYSTGTFYNIEGTGTTFLTSFEPNQYLFYLDSNSGNYIYMGQIFQIYDNENLWLFDPMEGNVDVTDGLYSSWSLNTDTADYVDYRGNTALTEIAQENPGWYLDTVAVLIDEQLVNCINRMRYEYLQQVMCGKCDGEYPEVYSNYIGMLNAMDVQEWAIAVELYNKLKQMCASFNEGSCGC